MAAEKKSLWRDENGSAFIEFTAGVLTFFTVLFGIVEFSYAFYQWNAATKAMQHGARLAAVSNPVMAELTEITGLASSLPGSPLTGSYDVECSGKLKTCTCDGQECPATATYDAPAMRSIVYGRGNSSCSSPDTRLDVGMCHLFGRVKEENVTVRYSYTGLGYAGRPGGPVPTITVSLSDLEFEFILLAAFLPANSMAMPSFATTVTGEDLKLSGGA